MLYVKRKVTGCLPIGIAGNTHPRYPHDDPPIATMVAVLAPVDSLPGAQPWLPIGNRAWRKWIPLANQGTIAKWLITTSYVPHSLMMDVTPPIPKPNL